MKTYLSDVIEEINFEELDSWKFNNLEDFSHEKKLFDYQVQALKSALKLLYTYYIFGGKKELYDRCVNSGMSKSKFDVEEYSTKIEKAVLSSSRRFTFYSRIFPIENNEQGQYISGTNFFNRMGFWMATGSGKSLVIIKLIEVLSELQVKGLLPKRDILLLVPRDDLINQFISTIDEYNKMRTQKIEFINLKDFDESKRIPTLFDNTKIYYYRSDLLRDNQKESILDYKNYDNSGEWYIFLDEAHRGEKETSLMQDYVTSMSRNGFLFNFSATFTDELDYNTTCYNFNLERFINSGYGKNLYLSKSYFEFSKTNDEFSEIYKQKQVLKSLILFTYVKKHKDSKYYHYPLLVTLVNSVNTDESDLLIFFRKLEEIASHSLDEELLSQSKDELISDFEYDKFVYGTDELQTKVEFIKSIEIKDLLFSVFNSMTNGKIEIIEGEKGKEIVLKLETSSEPFALIKIGDAGKFQREKLGDNYSLVQGYDTRKYFEQINKNKNINILMGSRSFYEGWDSNRPNVINFINIGGQDAKKYVLQAIGRGIRIEPLPGCRKRLHNSHKDKKQALETLFVFATDKNAVKAITETVKEQKTSDEFNISLELNKKTDDFCLLIPKYKNSDDFSNLSKFSLASSSKLRLTSFFNSIEENLFIVKYGINLQTYQILKRLIGTGELFQINENLKFKKLDALMRIIVEHISIKSKIVRSIEHVAQEINHYNQIKVNNLTTQEIMLLKEKIVTVAKYKGIDRRLLATRFANGEISEEEFNDSISEKSVSEFKDIEIIKLFEHYYFPLLISNMEKQNYMNHVIKIKSEVNFVKALYKFVKNNKLEFDWMFSKIDESTDQIFIPYFDKLSNSYRNFYPDFIFWLKKGDTYKVIFVDPKGTTNTSYQSKIDGFEMLFLSEKSPKKFHYENFEIEFELRLITDDLNQIGGKYRDYWLNLNEFNWLSI